MLRVEIKVVQAHFGLVLALLQEINRLVNGNPVDPGIETGAALERFQRVKALDERLLCQVIRILVI